MNTKGWMKPTLISNPHNWDNWNDNWEWKQTWASDIASPAPLINSCICKHSPTIPLLSSRRSTQRNSKQITKPFIHLFFQLNKIEPFPQYNLEKSHHENREETKRKRTKETQLWITARRLKFQYLNHHWCLCLHNPPSKHPTGTHLALHQTGHRTHAQMPHPPTTNAPNSQNLWNLAKIDKAH